MKPEINNTAPDGSSQTTRSLGDALSKYQDRFDRGQFISWLRANKVKRHVATIEESEKLMTEIQKRAGGFSPRCAQRMLTFYKAAEDKIAVRAVTGALRKMRTGLVDDYMRLIEEEME